MTIDTSAIGTQLPPVEMTIDPARLRFFAAAIGETNPLYTDAAHAREAGHPHLPAPPTFLFSIELDTPDPFGWLSQLGVDLRFVLHGEQSFTYHSVAHAGDTVVATSTITDIYSKKSGALDFLVKDTAVTRSDGSAVADLRSVIVVRNPEVRQ